VPAENTTTALPLVAIVGNSPTARVSTRPGARVRPMTGDSRSRHIAVFSVQPSDGILSAEQGASAVKSMADTCPCRIGSARPTRRRRREWRRSRRHGHDAGSSAVDRAFRRISLLFDAASALAPSMSVTGKSALCGPLGRSVVGTRGMDRNLYDQLRLTFFSHPANPFCSVRTLAGNSAYEDIGPGGGGGGGGKPSLCQKISQLWPAA